MNLTFGLIVTGLAIAPISAQAATPICEDRLSNREVRLQLIREAETRDSNPIAPPERRPKLVTSGLLKDAMPELGRHDRVLDTADPSPPFEIRTPDGKRGR